MTKLFSVLLLVAALAGPARTASVPSSGTGAAKQSSTAGRLSDSQLERAIKAKLAKSKMTVTGREHFTVTVKDGVATLEGKTSVIQHKGIATRMAKASGAVAVNNLIEVSEAAKAKAAARLRGEAPPGPRPGQAMPGKPLPTTASKSTRPPASENAPDPEPALPRAKVLPGK